MNVKLLAVHQLEHSMCLCTVRSAGVEGKSSGDPDQGIGIIMATRIMARKSKECQQLVTEPDGQMQRDLE